MNDIQDKEESQIPAREYTVSVIKENGGTDDLAIYRNGNPIATLTAREGEVAPLVHAGNCHNILLAALKAADEAIEEATDIMFSGKDGTPVTFLRPRQIEDAYLTLCGVIVQIDEAIVLGEPA